MKQEFKFCEVKIFASTGGSGSIVFGDMQFWKTFQESIPLADSYCWLAGFQVLCPCAGSQQSAGTSNLRKKIAMYFSNSRSHKLNSGTTLFSKEIL